MGGAADGLTPSSARSRGTVLASAVAAASAVLCVLAVLRVTTGSLLVRKLAAWPGRDLPLRPTSTYLRPRPAGLGNSSHPAALPCTFNTLLDYNDVEWSERNGTADQLSIRGCTMKRYSYAEARQCLAGKRLVFVGDSVTRYQYLALIYFLEKGRWPAPLGGIPGEPSVTNEHEWASWNHFLLGTSALFGGRELCDCYRADYILGRTVKPPESEKFENRFYVTVDGNTSASHFTFTAEPNTMHGHAGFPPHIRDQLPCAPATCSRPADWEFDLASALRRVLWPLEPTHVILNSGLWGSSNSYGDVRWRSIAAAGLYSVSQQLGRVIWRTTTAACGKKTPTRDHDALALKYTTAEGWAVLDAYAITRPLIEMQNKPLWDPRHFKALVYRELNLYLLNMICETKA